MEGQIVMVNIDPDFMTQEDISELLKCFYHAQEIPIVVVYLVCASFNFLE